MFHVVCNLGSPKSKQMREQTTKVRLAGKRLKGHGVLNSIVYAIHIDFRRYYFYF